jgi:hypothetical protein
VIDPLVLGYSTYLGAGGGSDYGYDIAVDNAGSAYVTGDTLSAKFPVTPGAFDPMLNGGRDIFVSKLSADGSALVYSTYLGGAAEDTGRAIAVDQKGNAYVTGWTHSSDFPTTLESFDPTFNGGGDAYVAKLNGSGAALQYATYLGGSGFEAGAGIAVDAVGAAYLSGGTSSVNFPVTSDAFDVSHNGLSDAFVTKLDPTGNAIEYATYLGGSETEASYGIAVDATGNAFVTGGTPSRDFPTTPGAFDRTLGGTSDGFMTKLSSDGSSLVYSTFVGGSSNDNLNGIAVDDLGNAYATGSTGSFDFPVTPGAYDTTFSGAPGDGVIVKLTSAGRIDYGTFFGKQDADSGRAIGVDGDGNAYVTGAAGGSGFPTTADAFDKTYNGLGDAFLMKLNSTGSALVYSTFLGGSKSDQGWGIAVDKVGNAYLTGDTSSSNFPVTANALKKRNRESSKNAFVTKFGEL